MAKRNNGVFEPEFRLVAIGWYAVFTAVGFFGMKMSSLCLLVFSNYPYIVFGASVHRQEPWPVPVIIGLGFIVFGVQIGMTAIANTNSSSICFIWFIVRYFVFY